MESFVALLVCLLAFAPLSNAQITLTEETANNTSACNPQGQTQPAWCTYANSYFNGFEDQNDVGMNPPPVETVWPDPVAGHVTNVSLSSTAAPTLMYTGFNGQFLCNYLPWFGSSSHKDVGYDETNSQTTDAQATAMNAAGCNVALVSFYGTDQLDTNSDYNFDLLATGTLFTSVGTVSGLKFGIMEIDQAFSGSSTEGHDDGNCNRFGDTDYQDTMNCIEGALENDLTYIDSNYVGNHYWKDGSPSAKPVMAFFGSLCDFPALSAGDSGNCPEAGGNGISRWNTIWSAVQAVWPSFKFVFQYGAFDRPTSSAGEFAWPQPAHWDGNGGGDPSGSQYWWCDDTKAGCASTTYLYDFYQAGSQNPSDLTIGLIDKGFDDTNASWGTNRVTSEQCGNVLFLTAQQALNGFFGSGNPIPYMQIATWNDYEEGTEIETGIDNCYSISASKDSGNLSWILTSSDQYGYATTATIHHFTVWWSFIGDPNQTIHVAATNIPSSQTSISLSDLVVPNPPVNLYVEAVGMPLFLNKMSEAVPYTE
jgi:hypothetical protein